MAYNKAPAGHTEFGGGPGIIDPELRKDRNVTAEESLVEIYATHPHRADSVPETANINDRSPLPWPDKSTAVGTVR